MQECRYRVSRDKALIDKVTINLEAVAGDFVISS